MDCFNYCNQLIDAKLLYMYINTGNLAMDIYLLDEFFIFSLHCLNLTHFGVPIQMPYKTCANNELELSSKTSCLYCYLIT